MGSSFEQSQVQTPGSVSISYKNHKVGGFLSRFLPFALYCRIAL